MEQNINISQGKRKFFMKMADFEAYAVKHKLIKPS